MASEIKFAKEFIRKHYGGPLLSRQNLITHGKSKSLTAKENHSRQKQIHSRQKQFYPAEYTCLVWFVYFHWQFYSLPKNFWFRPLLTFSIKHGQKKPVSTIFIRNLETKSSTVFCLAEVSLFCSDRSVVTLHRRASVTPLSTPLVFLLPISVFPEPSLHELMRISFLIISKKLN